MNSKTAKHVFEIVTKTGVTNSAFSKNPSLKKKLLNFVKTVDNEKILSLVKEYETSNNDKLFENYITCFILCLYTNRNDIYCKLESHKNLKCISDVERENINSLYNLSLD